LNNFEDALRKSGLHLQPIGSTDIRSKWRRLEQDGVARKEVRDGRTMPKVDWKIERRNNGRRSPRPSSHHRRMRTVGDFLVSKESIRIQEREIKLGNNGGQLESGLAQRLTDLDRNQSREVLLLGLQTIAAKRKEGLSVIKAQPPPVFECSL
jgi:hypothetical protein